MPDVLPPEPLRTAPAAHLIAINCHPFHDRAAVLDGLEAVASAADLLQHSTQEKVEICLFWHSPDPVPRRLKDHLMAHNIKAIHASHTSNGANLNTQIAYANTHGFTYFYRVDGDDRVYEPRFLLQARQLQRGLCDICGGGLRYEPHGCAPYDVIPIPEPQTRDFLENRYVLHPSMAFNVQALTTRGVHYWTRRLEDKALLAKADSKGLRIANLPLVLGSYRLGPQTRNGIAPKWLGFCLNLAFLRQRRAPALLPYAVLLFIAQLCFGSGQMRSARQWLYRVKP